MMPNLNTASIAAPPSESRISATLSPEFEMLLASARTVPDGARMEALEDAGIDWRVFAELAASHGVRPLVYKSLRISCWNRVPAEIQTALEEANRSLTGRNLFLTGELLHVTNELQKGGIQVAAMKGAVIAQMVYGDFTLREFSDIDLLVREQDFPRAVEQLRRLGYETCWKYDNDKVLRFLRHVGEYKLMNGAGEADIDLHWRVATKATALSPRVSDFPSGFQPLTVAGSSVLTFSPRDSPLYLAAQGGWDRWCDLRRICDLAEFLRAYPEVDWGPHFQAAERMGGLRSMLTGLMLARELLGATLPNSAEDRIRADATVRKLAQTTVLDLQRLQESGEAVSRYLFQMRAKQGLWRKVALAYSILAERTAEDGNWIMLPRSLWLAYSFLRPLRMSGKFLRRA